MEQGPTKNLPTIICFWIFEKHLTNIYIYHVIKNKKNLVYQGDTASGAYTDCNSSDTSQFYDL